MIKLRFVEGGGWDSKIIRWDTRCRWSHVEYMPNSVTTLGAMLDGGVKLRSITDAQYRKAVASQVWNVRMNPAAEKKFVDFVNSQVGRPYDWRAIVSFGLGERDWRAPDSWFCSEFMSRGLELSSALHLPLDQPVWRITPRDLWMLLNALREAGFAFSEPVKGIDFGFKRLVLRQYPQGIPI